MKNIRTFEEYKYFDDIIKNNKIDNKKAISYVKNKIKETQEYDQIFRKIFRKKEGNKVLIKFLKKELKKYDHLLNDTEQQDIIDYFILDNSFTETNLLFPTVYDYTHHPDR